LGRSAGEQIVIWILTLLWLCLFIWACEALKEWLRPGAPRSEAMGVLIALAALVCAALFAFLVLVAAAFAIAMTAWVMRFGWRLARFVVRLTLGLDRYLGEQRLANGPEHLPNALKTPIAFGRRGCGIGSKRGAEKQ
jgi:hypothetical protein